MKDTPAVPSLARGRILVVTAAVLWSLSGIFKCILKHDTPLRLGLEPVSDLAIAFYRVFFAGLFLLPTLRRRSISFRPAMLAMVACFAAMNLTFVLALTGGKAANAILLQYTAPLWIYLAGIAWLGESPSLQGWTSLLVGLLGVAVLMMGGRQEADLPVIGLGLASGLFYAGVVVFLRVLRDAASNWLTVLNHLGAALVVAPLLFSRGWPSLSPAQLAVLALFGVVQMGLPYVLMAKGLRVVSPQEAGVITLLEPLLNPLFAYLVAPDTEAPTVYTLFGGACIVGALAWRYRPTKQLPAT
ncbi:MAG TPA: DMT family transporter [Gemmataceae bacterium]|nr:DMT family transporter [Gemmataceae bacterium]